MKHLLFIILPVIPLMITTACKKNKNSCLVTSGETDNMLVTDHNVLIFTLSNDGYSETFFDLDLDNDDILDLRFYVTKDSISDPEPTSNKYNYLEILNPDFVIPEIAKSGVRNLVPSDTIPDVGGETYPWRIYINEIVCGANSSSIEDRTIGNTPQHSIAGECSSSDNYNWDNEYSTLSLFQNAYTDQNFTGFSGDTLVSTEVHCPVLCSALPLNTIIYLPFRKTESGGFRYGWIELTIAEDNVAINQSAIQEI